jgi:D-3-phosphoglycerate dehydrogenase / 2-oxoglutarate reductase
MSAVAHRVVVTAPNARWLPDRLRELDGVEVVERFDLANARSEQLVIEALAGAWGVVASGEPYTRAVFEALGELRAVVRFGVGYDAVDVEAASDHDVAVCITPGANAEAVADLALLLMLATIRDLPGLERAVRSGRWRGAVPSRDLAEATVVIVGLGAIGRAVARRLHGFGCRILAVEPAPDLAFCEELGVEVRPLEDALPLADVVTLHAALTPQTRHLLGARELALLAPHAIVVNVARGALIDEPALRDALAVGRLAAAGLDVFETEPLPASDPLLALPNVIVSGHIASFTELGASRTADAVIDAVESLLAGVRPRGCLSTPSWAVAAG